MRTHFAFRALPFVLALSLLTLVATEIGLHASGTAHAHAVEEVHVHGGAHHGHHIHEEAAKSHSHGAAHHHHDHADAGSPDEADHHDCYGCEANCCLVFIRPPLNDLTYPAVHPVRSIWVPIAVVSTAPAPLDRPPNAIL